jgi:hypothetical protein
MGSPTVGGPTRAMIARGKAAAAMTGVPPSVAVTIERSLISNSISISTIPKAFLDHPAFFHFCFRVWDPQSSLAIASTKSGRISYRGN